MIDVLVWSIQSWTVLNLFCTQSLVNVFPFHSRASVQCIELLSVLFWKFCSKYRHYLLDFISNHTTNTSVPFTLWWLSEEVQNKLRIHFRNFLLRRWVHRSITFLMDPSKVSSLPGIIPQFSIFSHCFEFCLGLRWLVQITSRSKIAPVRIVRKF